MPLTFEFGEVQQGFSSRDREIQISHSGPDPINFNFVSSHTALNISPLGTTTPAILQVSINASSLAQGNYSETVTLSPINDSCALSGPFLITVNFTVIPPIGGP